VHTILDELGLQTSSSRLGVALDENEQNFIPSIKRGNLRKSDAILLTWILVKS